ncbi:hypothetical protein OAI47_01775 [Rhodospirillaceae bacterium]|nr:hypothetical protein [Rhodospirillaceae bacterium]
MRFKWNILALFLFATFFDPVVVERSLSRADDPKEIITDPEKLAEEITNIGEDIKVFFAERDGNYPIAVKIYRNQANAGSAKG